MEPSRDISQENARFLYEQAALNVRYFLDWRHRVVTLWLLASSALLTVASWMHDRSMAEFLPYPLLLAGAFSLLSFVFDRRNQRILNDTYAVAAGLASVLHAGRCDPVAALPRTRGWRGIVTYYKGLALLYLIASVLFGTFGAYFIICPIPT